MTAVDRDAFTVHAAPADRERLEPSSVFVGRDRRRTAEWLVRESARFDACWIVDLAVSHDAVSHDEQSSAPSGGLHTLGSPQMGPEGRDHPE